MVEFLKLYGYLFENRENILYLLFDNNGKEYRRDYKQPGWPFICEDCNISVDCNKKEFVRIDKNNDTSIEYCDDDGILYSIISNSLYDDNKDKLVVKIHKNFNKENMCIIDTGINKIEKDSEYEYRNVKIVINADCIYLYINNMLVNEIRDFDIDSIMEMIKSMFYFQNNIEFIDNFDIIFNHLKNTILTYINAFDIDDYIRYLEDKRKDVELKYNELLSDINKRYSDEIGLIDRKLKILNK